jgi:DNA-binding transcriptional LysR family regulator
MSLDQLKLFLAVANTGSFSRAAQVSAVTQSAISKRIFQLELQLGHRLFDRHGRGATLTDAGRVLVRHAESLLRLNPKGWCAWPSKRRSPGRCCSTCTAPCGPITR